MTQISRLDQWSQSPFPTIDYMPSSSARASDHDEPLTEEDSLPLLPIGTKGQAGLAPLDELAPAEQGLVSEFAVQQGYRESEGAGQTAKGVIGWLIRLDIVPTHMDSIGLALALVRPTPYCLQLRTLKCVHG